MKRILVIDNYDSFIYNLVHYIKKLSSDVEVDIFRNDKFDLEIGEKYDKLLLSPGPGLPDEAGMLKPLIERYAGKKSILGVCLGHQAIADDPHRDQREGAFEDLLKGNMIGLLVAHPVAAD